MADFYTPKTSSTPLVAFSDLPEAIQSWLASDLTTSYVTAINKKLGIKEERRSIIPRLILRLVLRGIEPQNFINELSQELKINYQTAKTLTEEIEEKVLKPIAAGLKRDVAVDVKAIYFGAPAESTGAMPTPVLPNITPPIISAIPAPALAQPQTNLGQESATNKPLFLYKERTMSAPATPGTINIRPAAPNPPDIQVKPVSIRAVDSVKPEILSALYPEENIQVVHYNTPIASGNKSPELHSDFDSYLIDLRNI